MNFEFAIFIVSRSLIFIYLLLLHNIQNSLNLISYFFLTLMISLSYCLVAIRRISIVIGGI